MKKLIFILMMLPVYFSSGQSDSTLMQIQSKTTPSVNDYMLFTTPDTVYYKLTGNNFINFLKSYFVELGDSTLFATVNDMNVGLATKQATLVSGTNIKTVNSTSLVGSGDVSISSDTTGFWAIVNGLVEAALAESDTTIGTVATLDSIITAFWAGTLGGGGALPDSVVYASELQAEVNALQDSLQSMRALISSVLAAVSGCCDLSDNIPPTPPNDYLAIGGTSQTQYVCTWTDPTELDLDSLRWYEGTTNDTTTWSWIASIAAGVETYTRTGRTANTTYWSGVKAIDDSGNVSWFSNRDSATTLSGGGGAEIFADDFEDGNATDDWTAYTHAGSNTITAATDSVYAGTYSAKYDWDGTNQNNYVSISVADATKIYITMYINYGSGFHTGTAWGVTPFLTLYDGATVIGGLSVQAGGAGADINNIQLDTNGDDVVFPDPNFLTNHWQKIELRWVRGATPNTGTMRVWWTHPVSGTLDSVSVANVADNTLLCDKIVFGTDQPETIVGAAIMYMDAIKIDSTSQRP